MLTVTVWFRPSSCLTARAPLHPLRRRSEFIGLQSIAGRRSKCCWQRLKRPVSVMLTLLPTRTPTCATPSWRKGMHIDYMNYDCYTNLLWCRLVDWIRDMRKNRYLCVTTECLLLMHSKFDSQLFESRSRAASLMYIRRFLKRNRLTIRRITHKGRTKRSDMEVGSAFLLVVYFSTFTYGSETNFTYFVLRL